ncbi:MAG: tRNA pseudouridine(38-40) synthase TruA [Flavobacteriaceae bacterium]|nr:tRNA pseudouridine(38-40) synthase TruA [Flavobacteriaceae bacterium]
MKPNFQYLLHVQFLGFRFRGWQHQPGQQTVEGMLKKTLIYVLHGMPVKLLASGRTDAKVSVEALPVSLILREALPFEESDFIKEVNRNLPPDIRILTLREVPQEFNVIQDVQCKEYHYYFSNEANFHPYSAPFIGHFRETIDIDRMREAAPLFEGTHSFESFCSRSRGKASFERNVQLSKIEVNTYMTAPHMPESCYAYIVRSNGFLRYQVRMMVGALVMLGRGEIHETDILKALRGEEQVGITTVAPASGLLLKEVSYK